MEWEAWVLGYLCVPKNRKLEFLSAYKNLLSRLHIPISEGSGLLSHRVYFSQTFCEHDKLSESRISCVMWSLCLSHHYRWFSWWSHQQMEKGRWAACLYRSANNMNPTITQSTLCTIVISIFPHKRPFERVNWRICSKIAFAIFPSRVSKAENSLSGLPL